MIRVQRRRDGKRTLSGRSTRASRWATAVATAFALAAMAQRGVLAQPRDPAAAETLFRAARDDMNAGNYAVACPRFEESFGLDPAPGTLLNLAICYEKGGKTASAWQKWQQAMDAIGESDRRFSEARARRDALASEVPKVVFKLSKPFPDEATFLRDGNPVGRGSVGLGIPVDPGPHEVVVRYRGGEKKFPFEATVGGTTTLELSAPEPSQTPVEPGPKPASPPESEDDSPPPSQSSAQSTAGWVMVAGGGIGLAFFGITGALILSDESTAQDNCAPRCSADGQAAIDRGEALLVPNAIGLVAGVVLAGAGVTLILLDRGEETTTSLSVGPGSLSARTSF